MRERYGRRLIRRLLAATNFRGRKRIQFELALVALDCARTPVPSRAVDRRFLKTLGSIHGAHTPATSRANPRVNPHIGNRWYTQSRSYVRAPDEATKYRIPVTVSRGDQPFLRVTPVYLWKSRGGGEKERVYPVHLPSPECCWPRG